MGAAGARHDPVGRARCSAMAARTLCPGRWDGRSAGLLDGGALAGRHLRCMSSSSCPLRSRVPTPGLPLLLRLLAV